MEILSSGPVRSAAVVSTGSVRIRPDHARRSLRPLPVWLLASRRWTEPLPINVYIVEHEQGLVLFDTGQDRACVTDPNYFPPGVPGFLYRRLAEFDIGEADTLPLLLKGAGYDPGAVTHVVLSHLHQDHIGGIGDFPGAEILVSRAEWRAHHALGALWNGYLGKHIDLAGLRWRLLDFARTSDPLLADFAGSVDLFGDGCLTLLPTPGHTPGSLSMLIRRPRHPAVLLAGDLTYDARHLDVAHLPGVGSRRGLRATTRLVQGLRTRMPELVIAAAHDPAAASEFAAALTEESPDAAG